MYAWVFYSGTVTGTKTPGQLAAAHLARYGPGSWAALELDDPTFRPANEAAWTDCVREFHQRGMYFGAWFTDGGNIRDTPGDADLAIAELEGPWGGPGDYEGIMLTISGQVGSLPNCPIAICTNFSAASRDAARPLIDAGFACLTEAYMNENLNADPDGLDGLARHLGWPTSQPVFGVYPTASQPNPVPLYDPWVDWPGVEYLGENVL